MRPHGGSQTQPTRPPTATTGLLGCRSGAPGMPLHIRANRACEAMQRLCLLLQGMAVRNGTGRPSSTSSARGPATWHPPRRASWRCGAGARSSGRSSVRLAPSREPPRGCSCSGALLGPAWFRSRVGRKPWRFTPVPQVLLSRSLSPIGKCDEGRNSGPGYRQHGWPSARSQTGMGTEAFRSMCRGAERQQSVWCSQTAVPCPSQRQWLSTGTGEEMDGFRPGTDATRICPLGPAGVGAPAPVSSGPVNAFQTWGVLSVHACSDSGGTGFGQPRAWQNGVSPERVSSRVLCLGIGFGANGFGLSPWRVRQTRRRARRASLTPSAAATSRPSRMRSGAAFRQFGDTGHARLSGPCNFWTSDSQGGPNGFALSQFGEIVPVGGDSDEFDSGTDGEGGV